MQKDEDAPYYAHWFNQPKVMFQCGFEAPTDEETERKFFAETVEKVRPQLIIPLHWDNFFSRLDKPTVGMPSLIEKTEVVFFKMANYCEAHDINFLVQMPRTSIEL